MLSADNKRQLKTHLRHPTLAVLEHPNQEKYPGQKISMLQVDEYVYAVPFIETELEIFLKPIIPSRKATRQYRSQSAIWLSRSRPIVLWLRAHAPANGGDAQTREFGRIDGLKLQDWEE